MTVAELRQRMSAREFDMWKAYDSIDPIGGYRGDLQAAIIARSMAGGSIKDHIVIDPFPKTNEQKQADVKAKTQQKNEAFYQYMLSVAEKQ